MGNVQGQTRVFERIVRQITRQILAGHLVAGERLLSERDMARRCGTSRVAVREAYRVLEQQGLVTIRRGAGGGAFVDPPRNDVVVDALALALRLHRMSAAEMTDAQAIDPAIARLAARNARPSDIVRLKVSLAAVERARLRGRPLRSSVTRFYHALADSTHNLPLTLLAHALTAFAPEPPDTVDVCRWHRAILHAVTRRDEDAAARLAALRPPVAAPVFPAPLETRIA